MPSFPIRSVSQSLIHSPCSLTSHSHTFTHSLARSVAHWDAPTTPTYLPTYLPTHALPPHSSDQDSLPSPATNIFGTRSSSLPGGGLTLLSTFHCAHLAITRDSRTHTDVRTQVQHTTRQHTTHTHIHIPVSYTHLTLPTKRIV